MHFTNSYLYSTLFFLQGRFYLKNRQKPTATLIYTDNIIYNIYTTYIPPPPIINTFTYDPKYFPHNSLQGSYNATYVVIL